MIVVDASRVIRENLVGYLFNKLGAQLRARMKYRLPRTHSRDNNERDHDEAVVVEKDKRFHTCDRG